MHPAECAFMLPAIVTTSTQLQALSSLGSRREREREPRAPTLSQ